MATTVPDRPQPVPDEIVTQPSSLPVYGQRYAVETELGRGGMGRVYRARDLKIERAVAVKVLAPGGQRERFEQEARAAGALNHPNIVAVYDVGEHEGEPYIVTELLEGETLREVLENGPLAPDEVVELGLQLCEGLAAAHRKGIVHRDLKPDNLFVTEEGRLKILDFGIARLLDAGQVRTDTGTQMGTPAYMSPEQVRAERVDARSDVFSLGAVLYEMLSGHPPFLRATSLETAYAIVHETPRPLPDAPLSRIVARCLEKDPGSRYADGAEVLAALRGTPARRSLRLRRRVAVIAAGMLISAIALAAVVLPRIRGPQQATPAQEVIAIFPFAVRGTGQSAYLGEGMVDLLSTTLAGKTTRTIDPHALLARLTREGWTADPERGRAIAAQFGARRYLLGSVVEAGSHLRIHATLYDADRDGAAVRQAAVEGESGKIFDLVDDLSAQIRAAEPAAGGTPSPNRMVRLAEVTTSSPAALAAYLEGVGERRKLRFPEALAAFQRATAADPDFALAHYTLAYAFWETEGVEHPLLADSLARAIALRGKLPEQDQQRIDAFRALVEGRDAEAETRCREILRTHPDDVETRVVLGEVLTHFGHKRGVTVAEIRDAQEQTIALDPTNREALVHLIDALLGLGEGERLATLIDRSIDGVGPVHLEYWGWLRALFRHDVQTKRRFIDGLRARNESGFYLFYASLLAGDLKQAEVFLDLSGPPRQMAWMRAIYAIVTGRLTAGRKFFDAAGQFNGKGENDIASWWDMVKFQSLDAAQLAADRKALQSFDTSGLPHEAYFRSAWLGQLAAIAGDSAGAERSAVELEQMRVGSAKSTAAADAAWFIRALSAWRAGRAADSLASLDRIGGDWVRRPLEPKWPDFGTSVAMLRGELFFLLGRNEEAERWFSTSPGIDWFMAPRLRRLAQIAETRGNKEKAIGYYQRFVELWKDCDPELRPQVDEARARLAALRG